MKIYFSKYQGTGNDFVMLDNLNGDYDALTIEQIQKVCDRRFGIGADGLIKINRSEQADFEVDYYNSDGSKSFCGNGARSAVAFAETLGINVQNTTFDAIDGLHKASKISDIVALEMKDVSAIEQLNSDYILNTGSPHYIQFLDDIQSKNIVQFGKEIRYSERFKTEGINVNLVQSITPFELIVNTYERGVEDETLSCGTGVTAAVLAFASATNLMNQNTVNVKVKGGDLKVSFNRINPSEFTSIQLIGPAEFVFKGEMNV
jgi:diaminopimelate epimerase